MHYPASGTITVERRAESVVLRLQGEIDVTLRDEADRALDEALAAGLPVVLDLSEVSLIGATGLGLLLQCARACEQAGQPCSISDMPPAVVRVIVALGLDAVLAGRGGRPQPA